MGAPPAQVLFRRKSPRRGPWRAGRPHGRPARLFAVSPCGETAEAPRAPARGAVCEAAAIAAASQTAPDARKIRASGGCPVVI
ncbi:hypothetical protein B5F11_16840 [Anaerotruncus colihominis]|uniref:Uncharacterized protein n=1 Tax=Anaerotruncus colihominis TaxID=169435 RepID=A0A1Y4MG61_9FIRM|nr:hypothetical protein B5F11_16840 [Anaerotruncus colihominis]